MGMIKLRKAEPNPDGTAFANAGELANTPLALLEFQSPTAAIIATPVPPVARSTTLLVAIMVALLLIAMPWVRAPAFERPAHGNPLRYLALAPVALGATLVNAALETAGMSFLPLYAMRAGWREEPATLLLSVLLLGAILLQLPIGWLGDRVDRGKLVVGLGLASALGALVWPFVLHTPFLAYPLLFVWGGLFVGIYTIMMAVVGSRFQGGDLVSVYAVMSAAWGLGAFVGPGSAGVAMDLTRNGLPIFAAIACAAFTVLAFFRRRGA